MPKIEYTDRRVLHNILSGAGICIHLFVFNKKKKNEKKKYKKKRAAECRETRLTAYFLFECPRHQHSN